jgi:hypothetical protein
MVSPIEYSAIKAWIISITRYLAKYCNNQNNRVNCISPGGIFDNQTESFIKKNNSSSSFYTLVDLIFNAEYLCNANSEAILKLVVNSFPHILLFGNYHIFCVRKAHLIILSRKLI